MIENQHDRLLVLTNCCVVFGGECYINTSLQIALKYFNDKTQRTNILLHSVLELTETNHSNWKNVDQRNKQHCDLSKKSKHILFVLWLTWTSQ